MSFTDRLIESTVPDFYRGDGGFDELLLYLDFYSRWGECKTTHELTREQAAWIRKNNRQKQKEGANASTGKGAEKRIRSPSTSREADVPSNKKPKPNNTNAKSPADDTRERDTAGMGNWDIWGFGRKLGTTAQDAGLALQEKFRQYSAKGDDA
jgi:hypothetical protein